MVKVTKVAAWDVDGELVATRELAIYKVRAATLNEYLQEECNFKDVELTAFLAQGWDEIERRVAAAISSI